MRVQARQSGNPNWPSDAPAFWQIRLEALENEPRAFGSSAEQHRVLSLDVVADRLAAGPGNFVLGAFVDGALAGTIGFVRNTGRKNSHKGRVWGGYVKRQHRASAIGRQMLAELLRRASLLPGLEQVLLTVGVEQTAARRLYSAAGFEVFGREPGALKVGDSYVDEEYMTFHIPR